MCGSQAVWLRLHTLSFATIRHHLHGPVFSPISGIPPTCFFFSPLLHRFLQFRLFRCRTRSDLLDSLLLTLFRFLRILAPRQLPWILLTRTKFVKLFSFFFFFRFLLLLTPILSQQICCIATQFSQPVFCVTYFPILAFISTLLLVFSL